MPPNAAESSVGRDRAGRRRGSRDLDETRSAVVPRSSRSDEPLRIPGSTERAFRRPRRRGSVAGRRRADRARWLGAAPRDLSARSGAQTSPGRRARRAGGFARLRRRELAAGERKRCDLRSVPIAAAALRRRARTLFQDRMGAAHFGDDRRSKNGRARSRNADARHSRACVVVDDRDLGHVLRHSPVWRAAGYSCAPARGRAR